MQGVNKREIRQGLERLGIGAGSIIMVHTSLKSFGRVDGGEEALIEALKETVGPDGLVIMPAHAYCFVGRPGVTPYDPRRSPSETGLVPATFWRQSDVLRSLHPTHSQAAWGSRAAEILADHDQRGAVGADSPLHRAAKWGGIVLQLGVSHGSNTTIHLAESLARVPYLYLPFRVEWGTEVIIRNPDGTSRIMPLPCGECPGESKEFVRVGPLLDSRNLTRRTKIGPCNAAAMPMAEMVELTVAELKRDPCFLLREDESNPFYARAWKISECARSRQ